MTRVKSGTTEHRRHRKLAKAAKGYRDRRIRTFKWAKNALMKAGQYSYAHRKARKRDFRHLWIARINAACRSLGISYSRFIDAMTKKRIAINRKMLAELAVKEFSTFKAIVEELKIKG